MTLVDTKTYCFFLSEVLGKDNLPKDLIMCVINWRSSEASETLSGVTNGNRRYIYIYMVRARHFSSAGPVVRNVGGVKCQPFLKRSNYW